MTWVKLDDNAPDHPKFVGLGPLHVPGFALYVSAECYASRFLTDGLVPSSQVGRLMPIRNVQAVIEALVRAELWHVCPEGYQIHDYLVYNPSRAQVLRDREKARLRREKSERAS